MTKFNKTNEIFEGSAVSTTMHKVNVRPALTILKAIELGNTTALYYHAQCALLTATKLVLTQMSKHSADSIEDTETAEGAPLDIEDINPYEISASEIHRLRDLLRKSSNAQMRTVARLYGEARGTTYLGSQNAEDLIQSALVGMLSAYQNGERDNDRLYRKALATVNNTIYGERKKVAEKPIPETLSNSKYIAHLTAKERKQWNAFYSDLIALLTPKQVEVLNTYLECETTVATAEKLSVTHQAISKHWCKIKTIARDMYGDNLKYINGFVPMFED